MERPAWLLTVKFNSCNNLYHPFILIVSFCILSSLIIKHENIIVIINLLLLLLLLLKNSSTIREL